jgi:hypothetical protein
VNQMSITEMLFAIESAEQVFAFDSRKTALLRHCLFRDDCEDLCNEQREKDRRTSAQRADCRGPR